MNDGLVAVVSVVILGIWAIALWTMSVMDDLDPDPFEIDEDF